MARLSQAQKNQLKTLMREFKRLQARLQAIHKQSGYEDLGHGALALQIAEHTVEAQLTKALHRCEAFFARHGLPLS